MTLIINGQTGQWVTQHDSSKDVLRVPMTVESLDIPQERFLVSIAGGRLRLDWGQTRHSVTFGVP